MRIICYEMVCDVLIAYYSVPERVILQGRVNLTASSHTSCMRFTKNSFLCQTVPLLGEPCHFCSPFQETLLIFLFLLLHLLRLTCTHPYLSMLYGLTFKTPSDMDFMINKKR